MNRLILIFILLTLNMCSKPKTILICGDHECINKQEANQYFKENLSLEVKIVDKKRKLVTDLVELNLIENSENKQITMKSKKRTDKVVKKLSKQEIKKIKQNLNKKKKKMIMKEEKLKNKKENIVSLKNKKKIKETTKLKKSSIIQNDDRIDVCTIIEKCSIDEISKYLMKIGTNKDFPNLTIRE